MITESRAPQTVAETVPSSAPSGPIEGGRQDAGRIDGSQMAPLAIAEFERRMQWRAAPAVVFLCILAVLLGVALWPAVFPGSRLSGLPDDPDVFAAAALLRGHVAPPSRELQFESALTGPIDLGIHAAGDAESRFAMCERLLESARGRLGGDPRVESAHARRSTCCAIATCTRRAGIGWRSMRRTSTARRASVWASRWRSRPRSSRARSSSAGRLAAIAQLAAVPHWASEYDEALYDRAVLLDRVGRGARRGGWRGSG
jgi:hypothetical protein